VARRAPRGGWLLSAAAGEVDELGAGLGRGQRRHPRSAPGPGRPARRARPDLRYRDDERPRGMPAAQALDDGRGSPRRPRPRPARTTRFITLERAAIRRSSPPAPSIVSEIEDQIRLSSAMTGVDRACARGPAEDRLARRRRGGSDGTADAEGQQPAPAAAVAAEQLVGPRRAPTCPRRSSGTPAAGCRARASWIGVTMDHAASTSSARVNSDWSPSIESRISVSYASGRIGPRNAAAVR